MRQEAVKGVSEFEADNDAPSSIHNAFPRRDTRRGTLHRCQTMFPFNDISEIVNREGILAYHRYSILFAVLTGTIKLTIRSAGKLCPRISERIPFQVLFICQWNSLPPSGSKIIRFSCAWTDSNIGNRIIFQSVNEYLF